MRIDHWLDRLVKNCLFLLSKQIPNYHLTLIGLGHETGRGEETRNRKEETDDCLCTALHVRRVLPRSTSALTRVIEGYICAATFAGATTNLIGDYVSLWSLHTVIVI